MVGLVLLGRVGHQVWRMIIPWTIVSDSGWLALHSSDVVFPWLEFPSHGGSSVPARCTASMVSFQSGLEPGHERHYRSLNVSPEFEVLDDDASQEPGHVREHHGDNC